MILLQPPWQCMHNSIVPDCERLKLIPYWNLWLLIFPVAYANISLHDIFSGYTLAFNRIETQLNLQCIHNIISWECELLESIQYRNILVLCFRVAYANTFVFDAFSSIYKNWHELETYDTNECVWRVVYTVTICLRVPPRILGWQFTVGFQCVIGW